MKFSSTRTQGHMDSPQFTTLTMTTKNVRLQEILGEIFPQVNFLPIGVYA